MDRRGFIRRGIAGLTASALVAQARSAVEVGVSSSTIKVGQSAVFSGPSAGLGREMKEGIEAYFKAVNAAGGVSGRALKLVSFDDGYEPARALANTRQLIEDERVFGLLGYVGTPTSNAALPLVSAAGVPFVGAFTGARSLREPFNPLVFNVRASYIDEGPGIVNILTEFPGARLAIFVQDDAYGVAVRESIERALVAKKMLPVVVAKVPRNSTDVKAAAKAIAASGANAVALGSVYGACAALVGELHNLGCYPLFASVSFIGTSNLLELVGGTAEGIGISQVMPYPFSGATPVTREYQQAMAAAGFRKLGYGSMEGFVAAKTFVLGLKRAGAEPTRASFVRGLESVGMHDFGGFAIEFSPQSHNGSRFAEMTVVGPEGRLLR